MVGLFSRAAARRPRPSARPRRAPAAAAAAAAAIQVTATIQTGRDTGGRGFSAGHVTLPTFMGAKRKAGKPAPKKSPAKKRAAKQVAPKKTAAAPRKKAAAAPRKKTAAAAKKTASRRPAAAMRGLTPEDLAARIAATGLVPTAYLLPWEPIHGPGDYAAIACALRDLAKGDFP